mgnify:CR=1 FL=1
MKKVLLLSILGVVLVFFACNASKKIPDMVGADVSVASKKTKNIILMIGDGMGLTQITAGMYMNNNKTVFEEFKHIGLLKTYSSDKLVTDSAAGATAYACGIKTYNGAIGVNPDTTSIQTILESAEEAGLETGMVATSVITHATPASFAAHQPNRKMYEEIAEDFLDVPMEVLIGGGRLHFESRDDERNLVDSLRARGYEILDTITEASAVMDKFVVFTAASQPVKVREGRTYLPKAAKVAVERLSRSKKGFFLMVEGSQIDWGGHANDSDYIITEMHDFDKTIQGVLDFVKADGETLLLITADHETGGYAINPGSVMNDTIVGAFTSDYHTAVMVPIFAYGPGAENFTGIYENTDVYQKMMDALGLKRTE